AIVAAGHQRCSTASNHSLDRGVAGIERTLEVLAEWGVSQHGMARTPEEIEPSVIDIGGIALSHLSYTYSYNGLQPPRGEPWRSALIDPGRIIDDAQRARERGAEVVVISMHWGGEGNHSVTALQRSQAEAITGSGLVDLIVG
ncbi:CapA family protein, partial [Arthrospira platensis SPKY2]